MPYRRGSTGYRRNRSSYRRRYNNNNNNNNGDNNNRMYNNKYPLYNNNRFGQTSGALPQKFHFKRHLTTTAGTLGSTLKSESLNVQFDLMPGFAEFQSLYSFYRFNYVVFKFTNLNPYSTPQASANNCGIPIVHTVLDPLNGTAITSIDAMREFSTYKRSSKPVVTRKYRPNVLQQVIGGASGTGLPKFKQWVAMPDAGLPHFGFKYILDPNNLSTTGIVVGYDIDIVYYFSCRGYK